MNSSDDLTLFLHQSTAWLLCPGQQLRWDRGCCGEHLGSIVMFIILVSFLSLTSLAQRHRQAQYNDLLHSMWYWELISHVKLNKHHKRFVCVNAPKKPVLIWSSLAQLFIYIFFQEQFHKDDLLLLLLVASCWISYKGLGATLYNNLIKKS